MDIFPVSSVPAIRWQWSVEGSPAMGGTPISGPPQTADLSCGGWWTASLDLAVLNLPAHRAYRAMLVSALTTSPKFVMPVLDALQPYPYPWAETGGGSQPDAKVTTFFDNLLTDGALIGAKLASAAYCPAYPSPAAPPTQVQIEIDRGVSLRGGEYMTLIGRTGMPRLHMIGRILATSGAVSTVSVWPPMRENYASGVAVVFDRPACTMKLDRSNMPAAWPSLGAGFVSKPTLKLVETFPDPT